MKLDEIIETCRKLAQPYCIAEGDKFRLDDIVPDDTAWLEAEDKPHAKESLQVGVQALPSCRTCSTRRTVAPCSSSSGDGRRGKDAPPSK
jgi:hypothetical protein